MNVRSCGVKTNFRAKFGGVRIITREVTQRKRGRPQITLIKEVAANLSGFSYLTARLHQHYHERETECQNPLNC